jgi:hypothetical protein
LNLFQYAPNPVGWVDPFGLIGYRTTNRNIERDKVEIGKRLPYKQSSHLNPKTGSKEGRLPHIHPNNHLGTVGKSHIFFPKH